MKKCIQITTAQKKKGRDEKEIFCSYIKLAISTSHAYIIVKLHHSSSSEVLNFCGSAQMVNQVSSPISDCCKEVAVSYRGLPSQALECLNVVLLNGMM